MSNLKTDEYHYLSLSTCLSHVIEFASINKNQTPVPTKDQLEQFEVAMQTLFILYEQIALMPNSAPKLHLEQISTLYTPTQNGLTKLFMACPPAKDAEHWFDYQKEFDAREQQQKSLTELIVWHTGFYQKVLHLAPPLPIPLLQARISRNRRPLNSNGSNDHRDNKINGKNDGLPALTI